MGTGDLTVTLEFHRLEVVSGTSPYHTIPHLTSLTALARESMMVNTSNRLVDQEEPFGPIPLAGFVFKLARVKSLSDDCVVTSIVSALLALGRGNTIVKPLAEKPSCTTPLRRKVIHNNRTQNSYALVDLDSSNRGVGMDSSVCCASHFTGSHPVHDGAFRTYHFVNQYEVDFIGVVCTRRN